MGLEVYMERVQGREGGVKDGKKGQRRRKGSF